jgi:mono/diheme cytochrome c family protein
MKLTMKLTMTYAVLILAGGATAWAQASAKDSYMSKCAVCHGPDGAGKTAMGKKLKVQDAHAAVGKMSEDEMITVVTNGKGQGMAGFSKQFSKDQIKGLVDYYRSLGQ